MPQLKDRRSKRLLSPLRGWEGCRMRVMWGAVCSMTRRNCLENSPFCDGVPQGFWLPLHAQHRRSSSLDFGRLRGSIHLHLRPMQFPVQHSGRARQEGLRRGQNRSTPPGISAKKLQAAAQLEFCSMVLIAYASAMMPASSREAHASNSSLVLLSATIRCGVGDHWARRNGPSVRPGT